MPRINTSRKTSYPSKKTIAKFKDNLKFDYQIYEFAKELNA